MGWLAAAEYRYPSCICNSKKRSLLVLKTQSSYSKENRLWRIGRGVSKRKQEFVSRTESQDGVLQMVLWLDVMTVAKQTRSLVNERCWTGWACYIVSSNCLSILVSRAHGQI